MIGFLIGLFVGGVIGITVMAMMNVASDTDDRTENDYPNNEA